ncbi:MAG: carboxypeptidase-like regulatory domain-containing protein, partial [Anaerolineae bacterium]|nr:carboxypeptidase-like regulatory domain-containing protein [Anaerolineae bacterium]
MAPEITAGISGTVYDSAGQPLANIEVTAMSQEQYSWWSTVKSTKTDASGAYTLSYLNTGIYRLRFRDERGQFLTIYHPNAMEVESALD